MRSILCVIFLLCSFVSSTPIQFNVESGNASQTSPDFSKRGLFNVDDIGDSSRQKFLRDAQKEAVEIAAVALQNMDNEKYSHLVDRWFGKNSKDDVQGVLLNFVGDNQNGEGSVVLDRVRVWKDDYRKKTSPPFCQRIGPNGRTPTAYYTPTKARVPRPSMHYCDKFYTRKSKAEYLVNNCGRIAEHIDTDHTTRMYRGANVLHEFMHYELVGEAQVGNPIDDFAYGASSSLRYQFSKNASEENAHKLGTASVFNADTYVYYAMHIWLSEKCDRPFSFPRDERDD